MRRTNIVCPETEPEEAFLPSIVQVNHDKR